MTGSHAARANSLELATILLYAIKDRHTGLPGLSNCRDTQSKPVHPRSSHRMTTVPSIPDTAEAVNTRARGPQMNGRKIMNGTHTRPIQKLRHQ